MVLDRPPIPSLKRHRENDLEVLEQSEVSAKYSGEAVKKACNNPTEVNPHSLKVDSASDKALQQSKLNARNQKKQRKKAEVLVLKGASLEGSSQPEIVAENNSFASSAILSYKQSQENVKEVKNQSKRKRALIDENLAREDLEKLARECHRELEELFEYYKEVSSCKLSLEDARCASGNSAIACLLEESNLPFTELAENIYEKLKGRDGITLSSVKSAVLFIGQRMMYGVASVDADVLDDTSVSSLWCWETRDIKLLPQAQRGSASLRRAARKKISERITALSVMTSLLSTPMSCDSYNNDVLKASEKLRKTFNSSAIRSLVDKMKQKNVADIAEREGKLQEKEMVKELERNQRNAEKEKKRMDRELEKEKLRNMKELKRLQEQAEKEERRREKEEADLKKQFKKQQEEAERDQKRREKEEAELKKQLSLQKQATMMHRFLKCKKVDDKADKHEQTPPRRTTMDDSSCKTEEATADVMISLMDFALSRQDSIALEEIQKLCVAGWHKLRHCNRTSRWGIRHNPKMELIKELKIQKSQSGAECLEKLIIPDDGLICNTVDGHCDQNVDKLVDACEQPTRKEMLWQNDNNVVTNVSRSSNKKLLQFDKSHRPAYYGTWSKTSAVIGPRHPLKKDPNLDYDVESDEEWEEEDPGESLSDCDKDNEEDTLDGDTMNEDGDESEDSFFVPDGYLSENEGAQLDSTLDSREDRSISSPYSGPDVDIEDFRDMLRHQKSLHNLTEQALRRGQPLVISNLMHEKAKLLMDEELTGRTRVEQVFLQALCMRAYPGGTSIDIPINHESTVEDQEFCHSQTKSCPIPETSAAIISKPDLLAIVESIRSNSHGMNQVLESLQHKFPSTPRSQLRNKVREVSVYVDNQWQVKKEILDTLGLSVSTEKIRKQKSIPTLFLKRCMPPDGESSIPETSPQPRSKTKAIHGEDHISETDVVCSLLPEPRSPHEYYV